MSFLPVNFVGGVLCLMALSALNDAALADAKDPTRRPNIIVFLADDLGYADLGLHGSKEIATPNIDSLAAGGVRCTNGYVSCPYCSPTRAGFLTGRYQQRFGHEFNPALLRNNGQGQGLNVSQATIADLLQSRGYRTALIGKWHQGEEPQFHPQKRGFDEFFGFLAGAHSYLIGDDPSYGPIFRGREQVEIDGYLSDVLAREAVNFIDRNQEHPFFIYLAFNAVHTPMQAPERLLKQFSHVTDENRRTYLAMTAGLDEAIGQVLAKLRAVDMENETLVFFFSDNGGPVGKFSSNGSRNLPLRGSKGDTWEGGIHVPFLVQWKGHLPRGKKYDQPVIALDILPTSLAAAGIEAAAKYPLDGVNLLPHLSGQTNAPPHDALYWRFGPQMAVRQGDWKLVRASLGMREYVDVPDEPMLFNLATDISEQHDLASQYPDKVRQLQSAWDKWNSTLQQPAWPATLKGKPIDLK